MANGRGRTDLLEFLDFVGRKGLIPPSTASARKASANKVLAILSDDEAADVTTLDLDDLFTRFGHLHKSDYSPESLQTYVSRTRTSIDDFRRFCDEPLNFRPKGSGAARSKALNARAKPNTTESAGAEISQIEQVSVPAVQVLPISIRSNLIVKIAGLPHDLTTAEAKKIANIILAHASDT